MNLTAHFTFEEIIESEYAIRHNLSNVPTDPDIVGNLHILAAGLERVRSKVCRPMVISSGYRSPKVNAGVKGSKTSRHMRGLAADFKVAGMSVREACFLIDNWKHEIQFRKLIQEGTWIHLEFPDEGETAKGDVYTAVFHADGTDYLPGLT